MVAPSPGPVVSGDDKSWVRFGRVARAHGVRGELRVIPDDTDSALPAHIEIVRLRPRSGAACVMIVDAFRIVHQAALLKLRDIADRDAAQAWSGAAVELATDDLPPCAPGEFYFYELDGAEVRTEDGAAMGTVQRVASNAGQPLAVLRDGGRDRLLPLVSETIVRFDRGAGVLVVRVPEGLWE